MGLTSSFLFMMYFIYLLSLNVMNKPALFVCVLCFTSLMTSQSCFQKCDLLKDYYIIIILL